MNRKIKDTFWDRTKLLIKASNMTQKQFSEYIDISYNTFKNWIYNDRIPPFVNAYDIALALGVSLDYLMTGKDRDLTAKRLKELESRKAAGRLLKMMDKMQKQINQMRPIT